MRASSSYHQRRDTLLAMAVLLLLCAFAYWPLTFHVFSLKNDALNYFLPVRRQISEAISNGHAPFWSPYFNLGYPLHGDMQSGVWNPLVQLLSLFGTYTLYTLQTETLIYVYLSGVGMYLLARHLTGHSRISLMAGAAFMLCGYNSDSAQFLNWIASASYLPFVFLYYHRMLKEGTWRPAALCGLFLFLLFTSAYPADFILTAYLLFFYGAYHLLTTGTRQPWKKTVVHHAILAAAFLLLSLPAILSFAEYLPLTERGAGASFEDVMSNPFHPGLLISYVTPLPVWKAPFAGITDPLERNSYFGLIPFALLILAFATRFGSGLPRFLKWAFVLSLLFSFGEFGGIRVFSYHLLPLMDTFRHPANAKIFTIFFAVLLSAFSLEQGVVGPKAKANRRVSFYFLLLVFFGLLVYAVAGFRADGVLPNGYSADSLKAYLDNLRFPQLLLINLAWQVPFLILLYVAWVKEVRLTWLVAGSVVNCLLHTAAIQPFTVVKKDRAEAIQSLIDQVEVKGYPLPAPDSSIRENSREGMLHFEAIGTLNFYNKKIGRVDYRISPSNLLTQNQFWFGTRLREELLNMPVIYRADTVIAISDTANLQRVAGRRFVVAERGIRAEKGEAFITPLYMNPSGFGFHIRSETAGYYTLFQNNYPRWYLLINGKESRVDMVNVSFPGFIVPAGNHRVEFRYRSTDLKVTWAISWLLLLLIPVSSFIHRGRTKRNDLPVT